LEEEKATIQRMV
jgi:hypothetical protein